MSFVDLVKIETDEGIRIFKVVKYTPSGCFYINEVLEGNYERELVFTQNNEEIYKIFGSDIMNKKSVDIVKEAIEKGVF